MSECPRCGEKADLHQCNIDGFDKLCLSCISIYEEEMEILATIIKKQEEENV